jgi:histidine triad (HIT) family protein
MVDCVFCKLASGAIPVVAVFEDEQALAFNDLNPQAPTHLLVIPRQHFADVTAVPTELLGHLLHVAAGLGERRLPGGFRVVANTGRDGGQTVQHVHLHVLGGRLMGWPPG